MSAPNILRFDPTFGWKEIIATAAAAFSLGAAVIALLNYILSKRSASSKIEVQRNYVAYDSRGTAGGVGRFVYYWTVDMTNHGGRPATLLGFRHGSLPRFAVAIRDGKLLEQPMKTSIYVFDKPQFYAMAESPGLLQGLQPRTHEELGTLNINIPAGETRSLSFALVVDNPQTQLDGYVLSLKMAFNSGYKYDLSTAVRFAKDASNA
ncbi:MAG: hypothetical protein HY695_38390 [Deltaproteobacteria bacterium]|nr:hypothetical protein [Deltaproteobacteria bacterium]